MQIKMFPQYLLHYRMEVTNIQSMQHTIILVLGIFQRIRHLYKIIQTNDYDLIFKQNTLFGSQLLLVLKICSLNNYQKNGLHRPNWQSIYCIISCNYASGTKIYLKSQAKACSIHRQRYAQKTFIQDRNSESNLSI